jgi:hypothetical protein
MKNWWCEIRGALDWAGRVGCATATVFALVGLVTSACAAVVNVTSVAALQTAINRAVAGDVLVLADGTYTNTTLTIPTAGITVRAATPGGVFLNGTTAITISGDGVGFSGFQFTSGSTPGIVVTVTANRVALSQLNFSGYSAQKYINLQGQYDEVAYCNFENKPVGAPAGNLVHIDPGAGVPNYARIHHCSFRNMPGPGGDNGNECIRIANGVQSASACRTIVEYCLFTNTGGGDSEAISVKSQENVLRYNTFRDNPNAMMVFRNGDNNVAYGNFFLSSGGIRVKEANNIFCYNNYFERAGLGGSMNAVTYLYVSPNLRNINFLHNTFVECGLIDLASGATQNTWANNLFQRPLARSSPARPRASRGQVTSTLARLGSRSLLVFAALTRVWSSTASATMDSARAVRRSRPRPPAIRRCSMCRASTTIPSCCST